MPDRKIARKTSARSLSASERYCIHCKTDCRKAIHATATNVRTRAIAWRPSMACRRQPASHGSIGNSTSAPTMAPIIIAQRATRPRRRYERCFLIAKTSAVSNSTSVASISGRATTFRSGASAGRPRKCASSAWRRPDCLMRFRSIDGMQSPYVIKLATTSPKAGRSKIWHCGGNRDRWRRRLAAALHEPGQPPSPGTPNRGQGRALLPAMLRRRGQVFGVDDVSRRSMTGAARCGCLRVPRR